MRHVTIALSDAQEALLSQRLANSDFADLNQYVAALLDAELKMDPQDRLEALLLEGLDGEDSEGTLDEVFDRIRRGTGLAS